MALNYRCSDASVAAERVISCLHSAVLHCVATLHNFSVMLKHAICTVRMSVPQFMKLFVTKKFSHVTLQ